MNSFDFISKLKREGFRITSARRALVEMFFDNKKPITIHQITEFLKKKNVIVNKTTIYRELDFLAKYGFIHELQIANNIVHYELLDQDHHHHLICNNCGNIEDISFSEKNLIHDVAMKSKFTVERHHLEFFGLCVNCH